LHGNAINLATANETAAFLVQSCAADDRQLAVAIDFWRALIDADRKAVPAGVLSSSGRWAFVTGVADGVWAELTLRVLTVTGGSIDLVTDVAERCETATAAADAGQILLLLLGQGEPWEQHFVAQAAIKALPTLAASNDRKVRHLRTRLIDLGYHAAEDIALPEVENDES
jgi:hypothetical protein